MHVTNCLKGVDTEIRHGQLKTNARVNMWNTHSEDDGECVFDQTNDKVGEQKSYVFVLVCAALEGNK